MTRTCFCIVLACIAGLSIGLLRDGVDPVVAGPAAKESTFAPPGTFNVRLHGARGDGKTDDTAAFQRALDAAGEAHGGAVLVPRGNYHLAGSLNVPPAVTLEGIWRSVPAHNGIRNQGLPKPTDDGSTLLVTGGQGARTARHSLP